MAPSAINALLAARARGVPLAFLRALAWHESRFDLRAMSPAGARGLFQIMPVVLADYNRAHGTVYAAADLYRPDVNTDIAVWLLHLIAREYAAHHPRSLATDWSDPRWARLLVLGWNRGFSELAGVGYVVGRLEREGWPPQAITADAVVAHAARFGAARTLRGDPTAVRWASAVVAAYGGAPGRDASGTGTAVATALALALGIAVVSAR